MSEWWNNSPYQPQDENQTTPVDESTEQKTEESVSNTEIPSEKNEEQPIPSSEQIVTPTENAPTEPAPVETSVQPTINSEPQIPSHPQQPQVPQNPQGNIPTPPQQNYVPGWPTTPPMQGQWVRPVQPTNWQQQTPQNPMPQQNWNSQTPPPPKKPKKNPIVLGITIGLVAIVLLCVILGIAVISSKDEPSTPGTTTSDTSSSNSNSTSSSPSVVINDSDTNDGGLTTTEIVAKNLDSTVVINMYGNSTISYGNFSFGNSNETKQLGTASGIIMSKDGYIITNQHVVINENTATPYSKIEVVLYNGAKYTATVVGADEDTDLAVIKIDATGLKTATFGDSDAMQIGDRIVTIGNSGGLEWSASQGIISGQKRDVYDETGYAIQCLQIDAVINPGNSGGPLINNKGEVIGINSAKIVYSGYEGLGFSIPIKEAKPILDDFIACGHVTGRVELGITGYSVTQTGYEGFMIQDINEDSCLAGTQVQQYDIITGINGKNVSNRTELRNQLSKYKPGDSVTLNILRITNRQEGTTTTFTVDVKLKEATNH